MCERGLGLVVGYYEDVVDGNGELWDGLGCDLKVYLFGVLLLGG